MIQHVGELKGRRERGTDIDHKVVVVCHGQPQFRLVVDVGGPVREYPHLGWTGRCEHTWQVSILGLGPIFMGKNEAVKKQTAKFLKDGGIFAFGLSERAHGADLYSSDMSLTPLGDGKYVADGGKYYIGNANKACPGVHLCKKLGNR